MKVQKKKENWKILIIIFTWRHISQVVFPFSLHHLCMQSLWANWKKKHFLIKIKKIMKKHKLISSNSCLINKLYVYFLTLTVPEQEQGASKVLVLSNSSSWQILQREIPESSFKSSTSNTISPIFLKRRQPMIFFFLKF